MNQIYSDIYVFNRAGTVDIKWAPRDKCNLLI